jgi:hypothetical protein
MFEDAVIHMGLMPDEFYNMTLYEYRCIICKREFDRARQWEHTRKIWDILVRANSTEKVPEITELMPLLTDPLPKVLKAPTPEEKEELHRKAEERIRQFANRGKK